MECGFPADLHIKGHLSNDVKRFCRPVNILIVDWLKFSSHSNYAALALFGSLEKLDSEIKLYAPSTLNIDLLFWHTQLI